MKKLTRAKEPKYKVLCRQIVDHSYVQSVTALLTLYALFGDNIRLMATDKPADDVFGYVTIFAMVIFFIEIVMSCIGKPGYFLGFFFWLDTVSTVSLILDVPAVSEYLFGGDVDEEGGHLRAGRAGRAGARAGRIVRVIRLIRIVKLYKAMQEQEAKKQRAAAKRKKNLVPGDEDIEEWMREEDDSKMPERESRVGRKLSDMTTRRVIILVLALLFVLPNLDAQGLQEMPASSEYGVDRVHRSFVNYWELLQSADGAEDQTFAQQLYEHHLLTFVHYHNWFSADHDVKCDVCETPGMYKAHIFWVGFYGSMREDMAGMANIRTDATAWKEKNMKPSNTYRMEPLLPKYAIEALSRPWNVKCEVGAKSKSKVIGASVTGGDADGTKCPGELRYNERQMLGPGMQTTEEFKLRSFICFADKRPFTRFEAMLETLKILFICVVLAAGSLVFSRDANMLVLHPLEAMISKVEKIRDNPLYAMKLGDEEFKREEMQKHKQNQLVTNAVGWRAVKQKWNRFFAASLHGEPMETVILEKTIIKIGTLLALGFGEAGANTIGQNMKGADTAGVNAMIAGTRIDCNIGYITIKDFSVATEVLQGGVMTFVNQIAEIVHGVADEFHGAVNRNAGDSFLLIWQTQRRTRNDIKWKEELDDPDAFERRMKQDKMKVSEMSFVAFVKILAAIQRSPVLAEYRWHPGLLQRLRNYSVQLAFALHHGWAIEGAIGSEFKIDASYLSPNVGIAVRLEEACKPYGVRLLISESIYKLFGSEMKSRVRLIDRVIVPGSKEPLRIYTMDFDVSVLPVDPPLCTDGLIWNMRQRFKARQALEAVKQGKLSPSRCMVKDLEAMEDAKAMRARFSERMFQVFGMAFHNYIAGEWKIAQGYFTETRRVLGDEDGPSTALLEFMAETDYEAPPNWQGFRDLPVPK
jgi:class 3 adenylate cyclase